MARTSTTDLTSAEVTVVQSLEPIGSALQQIRVNAGATSLEYFTAGGGTGDVSKVGTPVNNQVGVWTGDGTLEGDTALTFDTTTDTLTSGIFNGTALTASQLTATDASKNIVSLAVATYPSLTEISYVKGVTSAIQTQINTKAPSASPTFTGTVSGITAAMVGAPSGSGSSSGTNTGDQTITLTGAVTGTGTGSFATTIATPGTVTVSSTNSTATAHTHAITSSSAPGAAASILATDASGHIGSTGTRIVKVWATDITATNAIAGSITGNAATVTTNANLTGHITSTGNAAVLGSFTMSQLDTAVSDGNIVYQSQALGTPLSGTLTNCTGLPVAGITASTSTALGVGSIELGHASDTSITRVSAGVVAVEGVNILLNGGALGTPSSGTLTNATGLPIAGLTASTSTSLGVGSIELGHASDTSIARVSAGVISVEGVTVPTISSTSTLTNKTMTGTNNTLTASLLKSATTEVSVSAATAPSSGQVLTATSSTTATWQTPSAGGSFIGCRAKQSAAQSIGTTLVAVTFDAETFDTDTMHDNATNNTRITFTTAGYYQISGVLTTDANAAVQVGIRLNGSTYIFLSSVGNAAASLANGPTISTIYQFSASDYIEMMGYIGSTQNTKTGENGTHLCVVRVG